MIKAVFAKLHRNPIVKSSLAIGLITAGAKILGYVEKVILAYYFGTSYEVDVYNVVLTIILSVFLFFRELIEPGFLNTFLKAIGLKDYKGAWRLFNFYFRLILLITILLSLMVYLMPNYAIQLFAPGFHDEKKELANTLIKFAFPASIFLALSALTNITLNGLKKFALPSSGEVVFKVSALICLALLYQTAGIYAAVIGVVLGAILKLLLHLSVLYKELSFKKLSVNSTYLVNSWKLSWPLLAGVIFSQVTGLVDSIFASYQQEGAISALNYSKKLVDLPVLIFPYILSVVIFPYFSELSLEKEKEKLSQLLAQSLSWITLFFLPLALFFNLFSYQIVEIVFQRGAFDGYSTLLTAKPLAFYAMGMLFFAIETVLVIFYFANSNTKTPVIIGILCVMENILLTFAFVNLFGYAGIALALVVSKATKTIVLLLLLKKQVLINFKAVAAFIYKVVIAGGITGLALFTYQAIFQTSLKSIVHKAGFLSAAFLLGTLVYVLVLLLLKIRRNLVANNLVS